MLTVTEETWHIMIEEIELINSQAPDGGQIKITELAERAKQSLAKVSFANGNSTRARQAIERLFLDRSEYSIIAGEMAGRSRVLYLTRNSF